MIRTNWCAQLLSGAILLCVILLNGGRGILQASAAVGADDRDGNAAEVDNNDDQNAAHHILPRSTSRLGHPRRHQHHHHRFENHIGDSDRSDHHHGTDTDRWAREDLAGDIGGDDVINLTWAGNVTDDDAAAVSIFRRHLHRVHPSHHRCGAPIPTDHHRALSARVQSKWEMRNRRRRRGRRLTSRNLAVKRYTIKVYFHILMGCRSATNKMCGIWPQKLVNKGMAHIQKAFKNSPFNFVLGGVDRTVKQNWFHCISTYEHGTSIAFGTYSFDWCPYFE